MSEAYTGAKYNMEKLASGGMGRLSRPTNTEILTEKRKALEAELARVNEALAALEAHPEIERVMNLVSQAL